MVGFYFGFALSFDFGRGEKGVGEERVERGFFLREGRRLIFFGYIYKLWEMLRFVVSRKIGWKDFSEVVKRGFSLFVTKRLKYDEVKGKKGYIFRLLLDVKRRKDFFLRGTFEIVEEGKY